MATAKNQDNIPFYLRKADRPKEPTTLNLHEEDLKLMSSDAYKAVRSSLVRYFFDCFRAGITATAEGFIKYRISGEKLIK